MSLEIPPWTPPQETQQTDLDWAPLHTLDLSKVIIEGDRTIVPDEIVREVGDAFNNVGFIYAVNHGLSYEQVLRQFAIGQYLLNNVSDEDKEKYRAKIVEQGSFVGYKTQGRWQLDGVQDRIEQCNFGSQSFQPGVAEKTFPASIQPLIPEILEFARFNHAQIFRKLLAIFSRVLKLDSEYFWSRSQNPEERGLDLLRYAVYHKPSKEDDDKLGGVRLNSHSDFNSVSILWSQPITSLEVLMPDNQWRLVKHKPNALVINAGDALHFVSGGFIKPTIHRVVKPPVDQAELMRLGVFYFAFFNGDTKLSPIRESSVVQEALRIRGGEGFFKDAEVPTSATWEQLRVKAYGQGGEKRGEDGHDHEVIGGFKVTHHKGATVAARRQAVH
ncbi:unnamed protein product [Parajaminaea phylloscopi]